jgi:hypothetical protein
MIFGNSEFYEVAGDSSACGFFSYDIMYQYYMFYFSLFWFCQIWLYLGYYPLPFNQLAPVARRQLCCSNHVQ